jgi:hypothetical protein
MSTGVYNASDQRCPDAVHRGPFESVDRDLKTNYNFTSFEKIKVKTINEAPLNVLYLK